MNMRYFTRQLFDALQPGPGEPDADRAIVLWEQNATQYSAALDELKPQLRDGFAWLADTTFHDGVITHVVTADGGQVIVAVDASNNPWGQVGAVRLRFDGVRSANGVDDCVGDVWLYEELHAVSDAIELCVLLEGGELCITADRLSVTFGP
ncbi:hypothetical protein K227x_61970 [Rubripirellula lacrimiformis]|uniref:Uncharacterized protein n=1 Tax=Rubripirellula lacrimiformis TaxID=1930273 RepID=A0A517NL19_9BACT|nr:DUF4085 family protein [Rubripirellula lacrimiformis]QDT07769.1 hypothetical protein K227x_61970 [Rubripirellula lacrimiformis]